MADTETQQGGIKVIEGMFHRWHMSWRVIAIEGLCHRGQVLLRACVREDKCDRRHVS